MQKEEITRRLKENHRSFTTYINGLSNEDLLFSASQKWTAAQQLEHIYLSVRPVVLAVSLPKLLVRLMFGKAKRQSRTYDGLVKDYIIKLENGAKSSKPYIPKSTAPSQKDSLITALDKTVNSLCTKVESFTESELDTLTLPHPVLGKLTVREMLYFTIYHVEHHRVAVRRSLTQR